MMDGEEVYRARMADALAAAERETLVHARQRHLTAAAAWRVLLELEIERKDENMRSDKPPTKP